MLVPAYHHGNEVKAIRAAGSSIRFYSINRRLEPDLDELERLSRSRARVLYAIHYLGWPQPLEELAALCRKRGMILIEDCALAMLSEKNGRPLGAFGDYSFFCLYKTVPIPNGGLVVQNGPVLGEIARMEFERPRAPSVYAKSSELLVEWIRSRSDHFGKGLSWLKRMVGKGLNGFQVERVAVGDDGFDLSHARSGMSPLCHSLLRVFDYEGIRQRRRENFRLLRDKLAGEVPLLLDDLKEGVCPLFFPILVADKHAAARALEQRGVSTVEFWNSGDPEAAENGFADTQFLRRHVLELPIHQDITPAQIEYMTKQILSLKLRL